MGIPKRIDQQLMALWYAEDMVPTERIASVVWRLAQGETVTIRQLAEDYGITYAGASRMLKLISRVIPIYQEHGKWSRILEVDR